MYRIPLSANASCLNLIMHKGDEKDLGGGDLTWRFDELGRRVFTVSGNPQLSSTPLNGSAVAIKGARAHWLDPFTLALVGGAPGASRLELRYASDASIRIDSEARTVSGGQTLAMQPSSLRNGLRRRHPHLAEAPAYRITAGAHDLRRAVMSQLVVIAYDADDRVIDATEVQTAGILDMLFAYNGELGATLDARGVSFKLWAPTAQRVRLHVFDAAKQLLPGYPKSMRERLGVWSLEGPRSLDRQYYQYEVTAYRPSSGRIETTLVSDPYALSLSRNSQYAQVVDLNAGDLKPAGWDGVRPPHPEHPEASVIYETHLRDFSASDTSLPAALRGTYAAFTHQNSNGMRHLRDLQKAGLTHVQLLPVFDIATINEDPARRINLDDPFAKLCDLSDAARERWAQYCGAASIRQVLEGFDPASDDQCVGPAGSSAGRGRLRVAPGAEGFGRPDQPPGQGHQWGVRGPGVHDDRVRPTSDISVNHAQKKGDHRSPKCLACSLNLPGIAYFLCASRQMKYPKPPRKATIRPTVTTPASTTSSTNMRPTSET